MQIHPAHFTEADVVQRRWLGLDHHDEEWEGVYHVTPPPSVGHQQLLAGLIEFLGSLLRSRGGGTVLPEVGVYRDSSPERDYRIPDLVFVAFGREGIIARDGIRGGAPDAVVEILSPNDDSYRKLGFYAALGVAEVIIIEPESRRTEIWRLAEGRFESVPANEHGAVVSRTLEVAFLTREGDPPRLGLTDQRDSSRQMMV